jgi:flagellar motor switch protein FliG
MARRLSGPQKAAILLLALGEESAAEVLKNLSEAEIVEITGYMSRLEEVSPQEVTRVTSEFYRVAERANFLPSPPETKVQYLKKVLAKAMGEAKAQQVVDGMVAAAPGSTLERLKWHDPGTIAAFIGEEHPQVIAVILANLGDPQLARAVLDALPETLQQEIVPRLARLRSIPADWLEEIEKSLTEQAGPSGADPVHDVGPQRVASMINASSRATENRWLGHIRRQDPQLAERIQERLFAFEDFIKVDNYGMQKVLARTPGEDVVLALKAADDSLKRHFLRNLAPQAAAVIEQALVELGPAPVAQIEAAQRRIATVAKEMADKGELYVLERKRTKLAEEPGKPT